MWFLRNIFKFRNADESSYIKILGKTDQRGFSLLVKHKIELYAIGNIFLLEKNAELRNFWEFNFENLAKSHKRVWMYV